jgi:hypothetical protein
MQRKECLSEEFDLPLRRTTDWLDDLEFVASVNKHLEVVHPELVGKYTPEEMLSRAEEV